MIATAADTSIVQCILMQCAAKCSATLPAISFRLQIYVLINSLSFFIGLHFQFSAQQEKKRSEEKGDKNHDTRDSSGGETNIASVSDASERVVFDMR